MRELITTGNMLVARGAIDCGCNFFGGYPISPSSEVALGFIAEIPLVIVNVMRGGPSTGLPTRVAQGDILQAKNPTHGDYQSIAVAPGTLSEIYDETIRAFNLANRYSTPVFLLLDETIGHMQGKAMIPEISDIKIEPRREFKGDPKDYNPYEAAPDEPATLNPFFKGYHYHITGLHHGPTGFPTEDGKIVDYAIKRLFNKVDAHKDDIVKYEEYMLDDAEICIICYGSVNLSAHAAINKLREEGIKVGLFRPITIWPSPDEKLREIAKKFEKILVVELNLGQYLGEIQRITLRDDFKTLLKANGRPISPSEIIAKVKEF